MYVPISLQLRAYGHSYTSLHWLSNLSVSLCYILSQLCSSLLTTRPHTPTAASAAATIAAATSRKEKEEEEQQQEGEDHPSFGLVLNFVRSGSVSLDRVNFLLDQRSDMACTVAQGYNFCAEVVRTLGIESLF